MGRQIVLARLKAITYASGKAYVALSKGDYAAYLNELAFIKQNIADINADHEVIKEIIKYHTDDDID